MLNFMESIGPVVGVLGTFIAIYQWAKLDASKKRQRELQFLLAGLNQISLQQGVAWNIQINTLMYSEDPKDHEIFRLHLRARDDTAEFSSAIQALESVIDPSGSAIQDMLEKQIRNTQLNNQFQTEALKNPMLKKQPPQQPPDD